MFTTLHQRYLRCELLYAKDQRQEVNRQELTPSLNYQARGTHLQDGVLWDVEKRDIVECPVCHHQSTMRLDDVQTINTHNQGARDAGTDKGSNGTFTVKKPRHGGYAYMLSCNGRHDGGNCPECIQRVCNGGRGRLLCSLCASRCQVVFEDVHRYAIANAIDLSSKKKKKVGGGTVPEAVDVTLNSLRLNRSNLLCDTELFETLRDLLI